MLNPRISDIDAISQVRMVSTRIPEHDFWAMTAIRTGGWESSPSLTVSCCYGLDDLGGRTVRDVVLETVCEQLEVDAARVHVIVLPYEYWKGPTT